MTIFKTMLGKQILYASLAVFVAQLIVVVFPMKQGFWIPLTTLVVCLTINSSVSAFRRGFHRVLGTVLGVMAGGLLSILIKDIHITLIVLVIFSSIAYWSKCYQKIYYLFVFFITIVIILLLSIFFHDNKIVFHFMMTYRIIFTIVGSVIAYFFALLIMPKHQHDDVIRIMKKSLMKVFFSYSRCIDYVLKGKKLNDFDFNVPFSEINNFINNDIPIWSYDLLFDRYVYSRFILFLHRIHKITIMLKLLIITATKVGIITEPVIINCLKENKKLFNQLILYLLEMKKNEAVITINKLIENNDNLMKIVSRTNNNEALVELLIILKEIDNDLTKIVNGVAFFYIHDKQLNHQ